MDDSPFNKSANRWNMRFMVEYIDSIFLQYISLSENVERVLGFKGTVKISKDFFLWRGRH